MGEEKVLQGPTDQTNEKDVYRSFLLKKVEHFPWYTRPFVGVRKRLIQFTLLHSCVVMSVRRNMSSVGEDTETVMTRETDLLTSGK